MSNLRQVIEELRKSYNGTFRLRSIDVDTGKEIYKEAPKFLFRAENDHYESTPSSRVRFSGGKDLLKVTEFLDSVLRKSLHPMWSASLLQHYFFPTEIIDATSDFNIVGAFAVSKNTSGKGRIYIYPLEKLAENCIVIDLSQIKFARRPQRQKAYGLFHREYIDFQNPKILDTTEVIEKEFEVDSVDIQLFERDNYLYEQDKDQVLGLLNLLIDQVYNEKICAETREWLETNIPWTEITVRRISNSDEVEPVLIDEPYISYEDWIQKKAANKT
ncbi:MAG: hypothetical protein MI810_06565 [Flavobacteriales bacterium]|nr:hypothetical protein [Flavobacteriales bacterium]